MEMVLKGIAGQGWAQVVGPEFEASYLDTPVLRKRSERLPAHQQRPAVRKLVTPDDRSYKLVYVPEGNPKIRQMLPLMRVLQDEPFMPRLLWSDSHSLLFEFVDGQFPKLVSERFATDLGTALAQLHAHRYSPVSTLRYRAEFAYHLASLRRHDILNNKQFQQARRLHGQLRPAYLRRSIDYFDINRRNFIYDADGTLKLIDAGSFRRNRPTGQFALGSDAFSRVNEAVFWQAYQQAGADSFMYDHRRYLRLFHAVMKTGQRAREFTQYKDKTSDSAARNWQHCLRSRDQILEILETAGD